MPRGILQNSLVRTGSMGCALFLVDINNEGSIRAIGGDGRSAREPIICRRPSASPRPHTDNQVCPAKYQQQQQLCRLYDESPFVIPDAPFFFLIFPLGLFDDDRTAPSV